MMDAIEMMKILKTEYGINSYEDFQNEVAKFEGIDLGIFVPRERSASSENSTITAS